MVLENVPMGIIMATVTGFLTASAFVIFGVTLFNMKKKRNSKSVGVSEDPIGVSVIGASENHFSSAVEKDYILGYTDNIENVGGNNNNGGDNTNGADGGNGESGENGESGGNDGSGDNGTVDAGPGDSGATCVSNE